MKSFYRIIITYSGFDEEKDTAIIRSVRKSPTQSMYDPVETRRSLDFTFRGEKAAKTARARIVVLQRALGGFSISKVIDDSF